MFTTANVTLLVSDMDRAIAFYRDVLGLPMGERFGDHFAWVEAPGVRIGLHPGGKKPFTEHGRHMQIGLKVDDMDEAAATLEKKGVKLTRVDDKGSRVANFTDPDGNPLYLIELKWG
jgi:catechol 2,3-dioxygenase-like lactoylglutathione lyase family enzyme